MANKIENDRELQQVLWACYEYWKNEPLLPQEGAIVPYLQIGSWRKLGRKQL
jgi:hypothetical protein